jgi:thiamine-phosphate pyrophosphorylase
MVMDHMPVADKDLKSRLQKVRLCVITDRSLSRGRGFEAVVTAALEGGAQMIQFRDKELSDGEFYHVAMRLRELTRRADALLTIDDRVDVALAVDADGVHLGERDLPLPAARELIGPDKILGASARTADGVRLAQQAGADYLGLGAMFPTRTKGDAIHVGPGRLRQLRPSIHIPILAIGGITADNVDAVIRAGADGVAVIRAVVSADDIAAAAESIIREVHKARAEMG